MNKLVTAQTLLFLTAIQIGVLMGVIYDLIRIFRRLIKHPNFFVQIEDMLYWVFCGFMAFYMLYICNYAEIRPFVFLGMVLGGIFYYLSFSRWFMKLATIAIEYLRGLIAKFICLIMRPIRMVLHILQLPFKYLDKQYKQMLYMLKMYARGQRRKKYQQKLDKKVEQYLKNGKT